MISASEHLEDTCTFPNDRGCTPEAARGVHALIGEFLSVIKPDRVLRFNWCSPFFSCFCLARRFMVSLPDVGEKGGKARPTSVSLSAILSGGSSVWHQQNHRRPTPPFSSFCPDLCRPCLRIFAMATSLVMRGFSCHMREWRGNEWNGVDAELAKGFRGCWVYGVVRYFGEGLWK